MPRPPWIVWALTDGTPGHQSQTAGLINAIEKHTPSDVFWIQCSLNYRWVRPLLRFVGPRLSRAKQKFLLRFFYAIDDLPSSQPDVILSSGGNTAVAQICLAQMTGAKSVYSGTLKRSLRRFIDLIITVSPLSGVSPAKNNLVLSLPPAPVPDYVSESSAPAATRSGNIARESLNAPKIGVVLVGGDGAGMIYKKADWHRLVDSMVNFFPHDVEWLITTSRRTGKNAESALQARLDQTPTLRIRQSIWWMQKPERAMSRFLAEGDFFISTKDSLSMVAEAIYTNKPVFIFTPSNGADQNMTDNDKAAYKAYEDSSYIFPLDTRSSSVQVEDGRQLLVEIQMLIFAAISKIVVGKTLASKSGLAPPPS